MLLIDGNIGVIKRYPYKRVIIRECIRTDFCVQYDGITD